MSNQNSDLNTLCHRAAELAVEHGKVSVSLLQRKLTIGYRRAVTVISCLKRIGVIDPETLEVKIQKASDVEFYVEDELSPKEQAVKSGLGVFSDFESDVRMPFAGDDWLLYRLTLRFLNGYEISTDFLVNFLHCATSRAVELMSALLALGVLGLRGHKAVLAIDDIAAFDELMQKYYHLEDDEIAYRAAEIGIIKGKLATVDLQRLFGIGYGRATRVMESLEAAGVIGGTPLSSRPREILIKNIEDFHPKPSR
ncbi:hypothetical protein IJ847_00825 [Candidatus Saccharibacteria bacterium]|nr:hypothetical protein [Candidatus Saccharibacteria bacterium]